MIRHQMGDEFWLITQDDHARLSGRLAECVGNGLFSPPAPYQEMVDGIAMHDAGWPLHDEHPTLNPQGQPLHVLESPMSVAVRVWSESVRRAADKHPYSGLLVSLHVLALSTLAMKRDQSPHERYKDSRDLFDLNKFQHKQVEIQQDLRRQLELPTDTPLRLGLAPAGTSAREDLLLFGYHLLKAMDAISLDVCSGGDLFRTIEEVYPRPGVPPVPLRFGHPGHFELTIDPWPFDAARLTFDVPARRVPAQRYASDEEFHRYYRAAPVEPVTVSVRSVA
jgi:hypothetical protein